MVSRLNENRSYHYSKEQIERADEADILQFAEAAGIRLRRVGHDSYKGVEHDSLVITPSKNAFYWNSRDVGGRGALDFAEKYVLHDSNLSKGEQFQKAMSMVAKSGAGNFKPSEFKDRPFRFDKREVSDKFNQAYAYLTQTRHINPLLIRQLHNAQLVEQNQFGDALFLMRDPITNKVMGATVQGTKINHFKYGKRGTLKRIEANSTHGYGFNFTVGKPENLRFFESPIDAMSYYSLNRNLRNTRFVSMDGLKKSVFANFVNLTEKQLRVQGGEIKSIAFGVDNDPAGTEFMNKLAQTDKEGKILEDKAGKTVYRTYTNAKGRKINILRSSPKQKFGKDWNDMLTKVSTGKVKKIVAPAKKRQISVKEQGLRERQMMTPQQSGLEM